MCPPVVRVLGLACLSFSWGVAAAAGERPEKTPEPRTDLYGDLLPEGAVARMGSARLRHAGMSDYVFLPGGQTVLTAGSDGVLRSWDMATGRQVRAVRLQGTAGPGRCVTLSPDGKTLVAEDKGLLVFWEVDSGKEIKTLPAPRGELGYLYFAPDGKTLAVGRSDWHVSFWDWETGKERDFPLPFHPRPVVQFSMDSTFHGTFSPGGKWFVAGASANEPLGVFERSTGREVHRLDCHARTSVVSPDSKRLAVSSSQNDKGGREAVVRLFDLESGKEVAQFPFGTEDRYYSLAFSPDGKTLACGFSDHSCVLDLATGRVLYRLTGSRPVAMAFAPDGKTLVASTGHRLRCWDAATGQERDERPGDFGYDPALAVSPDGRLLASGDWMAQVVSLWDAAGGRLLRRLPLKGQGRYVRNLAFSADGQTVVASQGMGFLQFWDVATGQERRTVQLRDPAAPNNDSAYFYQLHVSPDGRHVSTLERVFGQGRSTRLALWETATGKPVGRQLFPGSYGTPPGRPTARRRPCPWTTVWRWWSYPPA
jgi:WD40 repeat protein